MILLVHVPENGNRPYLLIRTRAANPPLQDTLPSMQLIGAFSRNDIIELGEAITSVLK